MIKKNFFQIVLLVIVLILSVLVIFRPFSNDKIAYIDLNLLLSKYDGMIKARQDFDVKAKAMQANSDTLFSQLDKEIRLYEKERTGMTDKEKKLKEELLVNKQQQAGQYRDAVKQKIQEERSKSDQSVYNIVNDYIKDYGTKHNFRFILGATGSGSIVYADESVNLTTKILEGLNAQYQKQIGTKK